MAKWSISILAALIAFLPLQAQSAVSENFVVKAPTKEMAREFAELAEKFRKQKAIEWLGKEMPPWRVRCPLDVTPLQNGAEGKTVFTFDAVGTKRMEIKGPIDRMKNSVLPHEITHTVFAYHFGKPVPRWADEGGSVYSEDDLERRRHDRMSVQYLNAGRAFTLQTLFSMRDYPDSISEQMILYAEGYSISKYLIEQSDRMTFLNFVGDGMQIGWDKAARKHLNVNSVKELEAQWLDFLKRSASGEAVVSKSRSNADAASTTVSRDSRTVIRQSGSAVQPQLDPLPLARGAYPGSDTNSDAKNGWESSPQRFFETAPAQFPPLENNNRSQAQPAAREKTSPPSGVLLLPPEPDRP
jgi:hypothetical protein